MAGRNRLACFAAREKGTCDNRLTIRRDEVEARVLKALEEKLLNELFEEFCEEFTREMNRLRMEHRASLSAAEREVERIEIRRKKLIEMVMNGVAPSEVRDEMNANAARREELRAKLAPLENLSRDPEQEYFTDGMTDALITDLSKIGALRVISRTSAMHYKGTNKTLPEIARELNVEGVVERSVMRSGNRVRITAQLIQAQADNHLWAETYERDLGDVLRLQGEVAQAIAQRVRIELTPQQQARLGSAPRVNPEAYEAYIKGRSTLRQFTPQGIKTAQHYFEEAIQKDSDFAVAYVGLADCYRWLGDFRRLPPQDAYRQAKQAIRKALELDDTLAEAHDTLGWLDWRFEWNWQAAETEFNYAVELNPNYVDSHADRAIYLAWNGRRTEALAEITRLRELTADPSSGPELATHYHLRDYTSNVERSQRFVALNPNVWFGHYHLGVSYEGSGQRLEAIPEYQKAVQLSEGDQDPTAALAHAYALIGRRADAEKILGELERQSKSSYVSPYTIATIYAGLGDKEKAFEFLEKAYQERSSDLPYFLKADLRIDTLRPDPRFADLVRRVGLPQ
jgi:TolB-like protein/thioredoxin-like negative regulator of GroEL